MYQVDDRDRVVQLNEVPQMCMGAPLPSVLGNELSVAVVYHLSDFPPDLEHGTDTVAATNGGEPLAIVRFVRCSAYLSGPPNDEAFEGHPLANRGLEPYGAFEVLNSSWIRVMERMNRVHQRHSADQFSDLRHFILTFHDSVFECVAEAFEIHLSQGCVVGAIPTMQSLVFDLDE